MSWINHIILVVLLMQIIVDGCEGRNRIIAGQPVTPHSVPSYALIDGNQTKCGGSLISSKYVLTAAHCVRGKKEVTILLGYHDLFDEEEEKKHQIITSNNIFIHPDFVPSTFSNDIALVQINEAKLNNYVDLIRLPSKSNLKEFNEGEIGYTVGFGFTEDNEISQFLLGYSNDILTNRVCNLHYWNIQDIDDTKICLSGLSADKNPGGGCNGDSGGPLLYDNQLNGVLSFNMENCQLGFPTVFTRVSRYLDWIELNTDIQLS